MTGRASTSQLTLANGKTAIAVASQAVVYTKATLTAWSEYFGLAYKAVSSNGTPDVTIQIEESWVLPSTEGSSDSNWVIPVSMSDVHTNLTAETYQIKTISLVPMPYLRFKITGNAGNNADTIVTIYLTTWEL